MLVEVAERSHARITAVLAILVTSSNTLKWRYSAKGIMDNCFNPVQPEHYVGPIYVNPLLDEMARRYAELQQDYINLEIEHNRVLEGVDCE